MIETHLTPKEERLLKKVADIQIESLHDISVEGDPFFEEFLEECGELYEEATEEGINDQLNSQSVDFEIVKVHPSKVFELGTTFLLAINFILLHDDWFSKEYLPNARKNLAKKLMRVIELRNMNNSTLN